MAREETEKLTQILWGVALSRAVCTIGELGIADQIQAGSPQSVETLAATTGTHERSLYRILRFLASHGIFQEKGNRQFDHTPLSHCLRSDAEGSFRAATQMYHRLFPFWDGLHHSALTGEPGFNKIFKQSVFEYIGAHPEFIPTTDAAMTAIHGHETTAMLEAYDFSAAHLLADIGGGNGSLIAAILERYPKLKGLLFDTGHVVGRTRKYWSRTALTTDAPSLKGTFLNLCPAAQIPTCFAISSTIGPTSNQSRS